MSRKPKELIHNKALEAFLTKANEGYTMAKLHRDYCNQGPEYLISLPVFTRLINEELQHAK